MNEAYEAAELLSRIAHDLKTPIGVISETLGQIDQAFSHQFSEEQRILLRMSERGVGLIGRIAEKLRLAAALDANALGLSRQLIDVNDLLDHVVDKLDHTQIRREVAVVVEHLPRSCVITADFQLLAHALSEVLQNAVRHARRHVQIVASQRQELAHVAIHDDGAGVSDTDTPKLFRRMATHRARSGLGLGLATARELVLSHGGDLRYEKSKLFAERGEISGSSFVFDLPLRGERRGP